MKTKQNNKSISLSIFFVGQYVKACFLLIAKVPMSQIMSVTSFSSPDVAARLPQIRNTLFTQLKQVLNDRKQITAFKDFLKRNQCAENLYFW
jgi:hypothetical protein